MGLLLNLLSILYGLAGIINLLAYLPTVKDLFYKKPSANISTYILWTTATLIAFLYGIFILKDMLYLLVSGVNFVACSLILGLIVRLN